MKYLLQIIKINVINTFQHETAYFSENWGNLLSTLFYTGTTLIFVDALYSNIKMLAGYTKNEMIFLLLIGQLSFYFGWGISFSNIEKLNNDVRKGMLDFVLIKPVPSLFFITFRWIPIMSILRDCGPTLLVIISLIHWDELIFTNSGIIFGTFIFLCGQVLWFCMQLLLALPAFWLGNASEINSISYNLTESQNLPYEGYTKFLKVFFTTVVPITVAASLSASVMLGKSNGLFMSITSSIITIIFALIINYLWKIALRNYTSASS